MVRILSPLSPSWRHIPPSWLFTTEHRLFLLIFLILDLIWRFIHWLRRVALWGESWLFVFWLKRLFMCWFKRLFICWYLFFESGCNLILWIVSWLPEACFLFCKFVRTYVLRLNVIFLWYNLRQGIKLNIIFAILIVILISAAMNVRFLVIVWDIWFLPILLLKLWEDPFEYILLPILCFPGLILIHFCTVGHFSLSLIGIQFPV